MEVVALDVPITIVVAVALIVAGARGGYRLLVIIGQAAATFGAQFSLIVNWSIGRVLPILLAPYGMRRGRTGLKAFVPFAAYAVLATAIGSLSWQVPPGVTFMYGEGRALVQVFNFLMLALAARATALALRDREAIETLWQALTVAVVIHGLASIYQLMASRLGLPLIGISRAFGLTADEASGDVAAFVTGAGDYLKRPGGLTGEPKSVAVVYGIYIVGFIFGGNRIAGPLLAWRSWPANVGLALSVFGFLAAFSTSAIFGLLAALPLAAALLSRGNMRRVLVFMPIAVAAALVAWMALTEVNSLDALFEILEERTAGRLYKDELDPPVEASLAAISSDPRVALLGVGIGGSSFLTMAFLGTTFEYAYAPNVGLVLFLVELGAVGTVLFGLPLVFNIVRAARIARRDRETHRAVLIALAIAACALCLSGSGIPLGLPLAVGAAATAARLTPEGETESRKSDRVAA